MNNIIHLFDDLYFPKKAILIYENKLDTQIYVEGYDIDAHGCPINAHPLDIQECAGLATALDCSDELNRDFLKPKGLLPDTVLYLNPSYNGRVIWYSKERGANLLFTDSLSIPSGKANIPAMVWHATKEHLSVYALKTNKRPNERTALYHAPYFNIHMNGNVCMGTVDVNMNNCICLEDFIQQWEAYFFNSYFSHLLGERSPVNDNIVQLWQQQVHSNRPFPTELLIPHTQTLKDLIR